MGHKTGVSWTFFIPIVVLAGGLAVTWFASMESPPDRIAQYATAAQNNDSWWVADMKLTECFETEDPYTVSKKMREDGKMTKVTKSWQYKGRYDINWQSGGRFMERSIYDSKTGCENDQQVSG